MEPFEKRKHARAKACFFTVFRQLPEKKDPSPPQCGYTDNISPGGLFLFTRSELKSGHEIALTIYPSGHWAEFGITPILEAKGKILRVEYSEKTSPFTDLSGAGVQFTEELTMSLST